MSPIPALGSPGSRSAFVVGLLLLTAVLTGILGYQALDATRSHERVVEKTVREQVFFAAWEYTGIARRTLDAKLLKPGLEVVALAGGKEPGKPFDLARITELAEKRKPWPYAEFVEAWFRLDLARGDAVVLGDAPAGTRAWLESSLAAHANALYDYEPVMVFPAGLGAGLVYHLYPEDRAEARTAYGYLIRDEALVGPLEHAFLDNDLLPESLTGDIDNSMLFSVRVRNPAGRVVYASAPTYASDYVAGDTIGTVRGGLVADLTVNPASATTLVIGGVPNTRLPLVMGLLGLTVGLLLVAIQQLRREAELGRLRADFVSGVSHELRTPLAQIRMFAETLLLGRVRNEEERERSLAIIVNESRRLTHQVDNVLLFSRSERQALQLNPELTDLGDLLAEVVETFTPLAEAARNRVDSQLAEGVVARVDGVALRQAVLNLLDNAVKYGPSPQCIQVGVSRLPGDRALIWVEDQGPGVPEDERAGIWEPYARLVRDRESAVAGSGIGLAVVRQVATRHGGEVRVEAGTSGGARFVIQLPCARTGAPTDPSEAADRLGIPEDRRPAGIRAPARALKKALE